MPNWRKRLRSDERHACVVEEVVSAVDRLRRLDGYLLEIDANERSITHRLAICLEQEFPGWHVDCEYNRNGHDKKTMEVLVKAAKEQDEGQDEDRLVYPDIIVHHRGKRGKRGNLLAVEVKSKDGDGSHDRKKLHAYLKQLKYRHALFLRFKWDGEAISVEAEWVNGAPARGGRSRRRLAK